MICRYSVSQVPFFRYAHEPFTTRRYYFPMRNETMAALSQATVIVEASEKSGTHSQARACFLFPKMRLNSASAPYFVQFNLTFPGKLRQVGRLHTVLAFVRVQVEFPAIPQLSPIPSGLRWARRVSIQTRKITGRQRRRGEFDRASTVS